jgi:hypothetical protein
VTESLARLRPADRRRSEVQQCIDAYYRSFVLYFNDWPYDSGRTGGEVWMAESDRGLRPDQRSIPRSRMTLPEIKGGKDGANLGKLIATHGFEKVLWLCREFPSSPDPRAARSDRSLGALYYLSQHLLLRRHAPDGRASDIINAVRGAMGGRDL